MKRRIFSARWRWATWTGLLCCLSGGCAQRVQYVSAERALTKVRAGERAPRDGVLISEGYLGELFEQAAGK